MIYDLKNGFKTAHFYPKASDFHSKKALAGIACFKVTCGRTTLDNRVFSLRYTCMLSFKKIIYKIDSGSHENVHVL